MRGKSKYISSILIAPSQWQSFKLVINIQVVTAGTGNIKKATNALHTIKYFLHGNSTVW